MLLKIRWLELRWANHLLLVAGLGGLGLLCKRSISSRYWRGVLADTDTYNQAIPVTVSASAEQETARGPHTVQADPARLRSLTAWPSHLGAQTARCRCRAAALLKHMGLGITNS